jgi:hypothetical protein
MFFTYNPLFLQRTWIVVINRLLFCVLLLQALTFLCELRSHFFTSFLLAVGLQFGFRTLPWVSAVSPIFLIFAFKIYTKRTYLTAFKHFTSTERRLGLPKYTLCKKMPGTVALGHVSVTLPISPSCLRPHVA